MSAAQPPDGFEQLWELVSGHYHGGPNSIHGPSHWRRVMQFGLVIASHTGADREVVRLFALFHDSCRQSDGHDPGHGLRGAELAGTLRGPHFQLNDMQFDQLYEACQWHTDQWHHDDVTIASCWDADRMDLVRIGRRPDPAYLNTEIAKSAARSGKSLLE